MGNHIAEISAATNDNILKGIKELGSNRTAVARQAGIPRTTFDRKVDGHNDFTLRELGAVAEALDRDLFGEIIPAELMKRRFRE